MWTVFFIFLSMVLTTALGFSIFYLIRFAKIIMILEDDFSDSIEALSSVETAISKILEMQLFFDNKEVKMVVQDAMMEIKNSKLTVNRLIQKFVERSKQKYIVVMEDTDESLEQLTRRLQRERSIETTKESDLLQTNGIQVKEKTSNRISA